MVERSSSAMAAIEKVSKFIDDWGACIIKSYYSLVFSSKCATCQLVPTLERGNTYRLYSLEWSDRGSNAGALEPECRLLNSYEETPKADNHDPAKNCCYNTDNFYTFDEYDPFNTFKSAGFGARIFMPAFGLLGIDWAYGFDTIPGQLNPSGSQFHFSIGQPIR